MKNKNHSAIFFVSTYPLVQLFLALVWSFIWANLHWNQNKEFCDHTLWSFRYVSVEACLLKKKKISFNILAREMRQKVGLTHSKRNKTKSRTDPFQEKWDKKSDWPIPCVWYSMDVTPSNRKPSNWYSSTHHLRLDNKNRRTSGLKWEC